MKVKIYHEVELEIDIQQELSVEETALYIESVKLANPDETRLLLDSELDLESLVKDEL